MSISLTSPNGLTLPPGLCPTTLPPNAANSLTTSLSPNNNTLSLAPNTDASIPQMLTILCTMLQSMLSGPQNVTTKTSAPAPVATPSAALSIANKTADATKKAELDKSLALIAADPDGAKLLAAAKAKGVTIEVGDPGTAAGSFDVATNCPNCQAAADAGNKKGGANDGGNVVVNGVTLSNSQNGDIRIVVRDPNNIKTIVHELVHAVSTGDGNSKQEEGIADVVGSRIANRVGGANDGGLTGTDLQIFTNKQQFYPNLKSNNDIRATLAALGISVSV